MIYATLLTKTANVLKTMFTLIEGADIRLPDDKNEKQIENTHHIDSYYAISVMRQGERERERTCWIQISSLPTYPKVKNGCNWCWHKLVEHTRKKEIHTRVLEGAISILHFFTI